MAKKSDEAANGSDIQVVGTMPGTPGKTLSLDEIAVMIDGNEPYASLVEHIKALEGK